MTGEPALPDLDFLPDLDHLRAEAEATRARLKPDTRPGAHQDGRDGSRMVTVRVDDRAHVQDVRLDRRWPEWLDPEQLGPALHEAYVGAVEKAVVAFVLRTVDGPEAEPDGTGTAIQPPEATWANIEQLRQRLDRPAEAGGPADHTVYGPHGRVSVRVESGRVAWVAVDTHRLSTVDTDRVARDALHALRAAERIG